MGEQKLKRYVTLEEIAEHYGYSVSFLWKNTRALQPALLLFNGKPGKPYKYDMEKVGQIIRTADEQPAKKPKAARPVRAVAPPPAEEDELWP